MTLALSNGVIAAIIVFLVLDIFAVIFGLSFARAAKEQKAAADGAPARTRPGSGHVASRLLPQVAVDLARSSSARSSAERPSRSCGRA